jgi:cation:H+ antiporter
MPPLAATAAFGGAVLAAAFLLAWAAEALQVDVSKGLAMAVLAFIAVLPEYAVDLYFAASAARDPTYAQYAAANMTGSNRLLIGIGWSLVALCSIYYSVYRRGQGKITGSMSVELSAPAVRLAPGYGVDLTVLTLATLWSLAMPLMRQIAVWNGLGMLALFAFYIWRVSGSAEGEPELAGVANDLGRLPKVRRRSAVAALLLLAVATLLAAAKPFADSLIETGAQLGLDRFLLVQWLAPLASEAPELLVASIFALNGHGPSGISALLSSKVNQWTLLVGTLPLVYSGALGRVAPLPLDTRQTEELVLTASQSLLGVAFLLNGRLEGWKAIVLLVLFLVQLPFTHPQVRYSLSLMYVVMAVCFFAIYARHIRAHLRLAFDFSRPDPEAAPEENREAR